MTDKFHRYWRNVPIGRYSASVFLPPTSHPRGFTLLYLSDSDDADIRRHASVMDQLANEGLPVVVPRIGDPLWLDCIVPTFDPTISPVDFLPRHVVPYICDALQVEPPRIGVMGIGMGGQGALMVSYRYPRYFPVVAAISPAVDFHVLVPEDPRLTEIFGSREWARQHTAILHVHPLNWPAHQFFCCDPADYQWFDSSDRLRMKLNSIGIPCETDLETTGGGHTWEYFGRMFPRAIQFVLEGLERERLRIV